MTSTVLEPLPQGGSEALRQLNNIFAAETSFLDVEAWRNLVNAARFTFAVAPADGLLLAFDQDADYEGINFLWFRARYDRFVYIDRIVIAASAHGQGLGRKIYDSLFAAALDAGYSRIVCEINIDPPNPGSVAFHERIGFQAIEDRQLPNGKTVRYYIREL